MLQLVAAVVIIAHITPTKTRLNEHAMIMAHDAATTYLSGGWSHPVNTWAKTQGDGGFRALLSCGARAFDFRPRLLGNGNLIFAHGAISIPHAVSESLAEVVAWAAANGTETSDLVLLHIFACSGVGCDAATAAALASHNIAYITDCTALTNLTLGGAAARARLPGGGYVLALKDCLVRCVPSRALRAQPWLHGSCVLL